MIEPLSRRALLPALGALATLAAIAVEHRSALATELDAAPDPDAALLDLGHVWQVSADECDRLEDLETELEDSLRLPEPPEALFHRKTDWFRFGAFYGFRHDSGRFWYGCPTAIKELRSMSCELSNGIETRVDEAARSRRDEIVSTYDQWQADIETAMEVCGLTKVYREAREANQRNEAMRRLMVETPAHTLAGVALKLAVARWCNGDDFELQLSEMMQEDGASDAMMTLAAVTDLINITDAECQRCAA